MSSRCLVGLGVVLSCCLVVEATWPVHGQQDDDIGGLKGGIAKAKSRGVGFLQRMQRNGEWDGDFAAVPRDAQKVPGATALCALALMENGIPVQDQSIQSAADVVRKAMRNGPFSYNYSICSAVLFLHRLHGGENTKHADAPMIRDLARKIVAGQAEDGGWTYHYPSLGSDNSNTQFAAIALWLARKYDVPGVDKALARTAARFRSSQQANGGWGYSYGPFGARGFTTGSMTCAALLGLALDAGMQREALQAKFRGEGAGGELEPVVTNLTRDKQVVTARTYLASIVRYIDTDKFEELHPAYFLWSLERVATLYNWSKLNDVKWYAKGAEYLLAKQKGDGSWDLDKAYPTQIDTAFALLFLAKTNVLGNLEQVAVFVPGSFGPAAPKPPEKPKSPPTPQEVSKRAQELFAKLIDALPTDRPALLEEIEKLPGQEYDLLLAQTIVKLPGPVQKQARDTLQRRLARMPGKSLAVYINGQDNRELRLAAIRAAPSATDQEFLGDLIPLVENPDQEIAEAAHQSLVAISRLNLPKSVKAWSRWYDMGKKK